jgi:hypothetical protein
MKQKTVWILKVDTESGDHYVYVFEKKPSPAKANKFVREKHPEEFEYDGPGVEPEVFSTEVL